MLNQFSLDEGTYLVKLARKSVEHFINKGVMLSIDEKEVPPRLTRKFGVFVTINRLKPEGDKLSKELRGCIGYPYPVKPLYQAVIETAVEAAFNDPRFPPLNKNELKSVIFEVTILTPPEEIKVTNPLEYLRKIKIGRDGLIIEKGFYRGLLLPQVPVEYNWTVEEFLMHLCFKAGLPPDAWLSKGTKIYKFEGLIFSETVPNGDVVKIDLQTKE